MNKNKRIELDFYILKRYKLNCGVHNQFSQNLCSAFKTVDDNTTKSCVGKNSFLWEGTKPKVIITNPEQIKEIFNNIHDFEKPKLSPLFKLLGSGLANYEGDKWRMHRKIITPTFYSEKLKVIQLLILNTLL